ncbi:hypothetical protein B0H66DRAFT_480333 [Apodospora peruviana]|uniref:Uncharacterized protein n=1 Tax=Apodospora peruviana TaxID=516989 RepID=A0AAE0HZN8_9PEZI|nr:hypothetical protein B0H66DRAFT_480333 [Apodospora peruviana]
MSSTTLTAAADPLLKPWEISKLTTFAPSGRPGSSTWSIINVTITDPNDYSNPPPLNLAAGLAVNKSTTTADCGFKWQYDNFASAYDHVEHCTAVSEGSWTFEMLEASNSSYPSPLTDFVLRFKRSVPRASRRVRGPLSWVGDARFVVGDNMRGLCSASGVCSFGLKEENTPFYINQTRLG